MGVVVICGVPLWIYQTDIFPDFKLEIIVQNAVREIFIELTSEQFPGF